MARQPPHRGDNETGEWEALYDEPEPKPPQRRGIVSASSDATLMLEDSFALLGGALLEEDTDPGRAFQRPATSPSPFDTSDDASDGNDGTTDETDSPDADYPEPSLVTDPFAYAEPSHQPAAPAPSLNAASTQILTPELVRGLGLPAGGQAKAPTLNTASTQILEPQHVRDLLSSVRTPAARQPDDSTRMLEVSDPDATRLLDASLLGQSRVSRSMQAVTAPAPAATTPRMSRSMPVVSMPAVASTPAPAPSRNSRSIPIVAPAPSPSPATSAKSSAPLQAPRATTKNALSTRMMQAVDAEAIWRPAAVQRQSAQPDLLAWEKDEGTMFRLASAAGAALRVLSGGKAAAAEKEKPPALPASAAQVDVHALPILDGIPRALLDQAIASGAIATYEHGRDHLLEVESAALLVVEGQVALGQFDRAKLEVERNAQNALDPKDKKAAKKEAKRRLEAGPLIRLAEKNIAFFEKGDLVQLRGEGAPAGLALGAYTVTPVTCVAIAPALLDQLQRTYQFFADRVRRASTAARSRIDAVGGARAEVADFFVRHGLSVSQILRVRAIDMCIECGYCEKACEDRYGAKRLSLNGRVLGTLDFVDACHTCTDQRCIDPCAFDAIKYDTEKKEIVIIEAACTGCTLCATACPYAAIEMHDFEDKPLLQIRLQKENKLGFGDGLPLLQTQFGEIKPRKAKAKRIASKCDHCIDYGDQACISACPTGALVDVEPGDVFGTRSAEVALQADDGFDHSVFIDIRKINDPRIFQQGLSSKAAQDIDKARKVKPGLTTGWMWAVGLGAWMLCLVEIMLRKFVPHFSGDFFWQRFVQHIDAEIAINRVDFHAGSAFAVRLGYVGSVIMFSGLLYPLRRRVPLFKNVGSQRAWFDVHVLTGVVGPLFVVLHGANKFDNWVTLAVVAMALTSFTGLAGRYLFTQLPEWSSAAGLHAMEESGILDKLKTNHPGLRALDNWFDAYSKRVGTVAEQSSLRVLMWLASDFLRRLALRSDLQARVVGVVDPTVRKDSVRAALRRAHFERQKVLLPRIEPLFRRWKFIHVPAAIGLTALGGAHIVLALLS